MMTFQIQVHGDTSTRWMASDEELRGQIKTLVESVMKVHTEGSVPKVIVTIEKCVCEVCAERHEACMRCAR